VLVVLCLHRAADLGGTPDFEGLLVGAQAVTLWLDASVLGVRKRVYKAPVWRFLECGVYITCIECCVPSITRVGQRHLLVLHVCGQFMFPVGAVWFEVRLGTQNCAKGSCVELS
jgi:hypothetical protein